MRKQINKKQSGQVLLLTVMLLATVITVVMTVTFRSTTDTQTTKLEEESQKALAAAEAGIEAALKKSQSSTPYSFNDLQLPSFAGIDENTSNVTINETRVSKHFISPLLQKDEQYTFYLADYPTFANTFKGRIIPYFDSNNAVSERCGSAIEATIIYENDSESSNPGYATKRFLYEPCAGQARRVQGSSSTVIEGSYKFEDNTEFKYQGDGIVISDTPNAKVLILRVLFQSTKIGFESDENLLPVQGKYVISEAKSTTGVTKRIQLFQSYPQIPAEYFITGL